MPFVKNNPVINDWLNSSNTQFALLGDSEYKSLLKNWRGVFDIYLEKNQFDCKGDKAMLAMENLLPIEAFIFNFPGYKKLPVVTNSKGAVYAYHVESLQKIDRSVFNHNDSIVCDASFQSTCVYTHEWQFMSAPMYYKSE